jgi:hypothetical protein
MALVKTILKISAQEAIIKWTGSGTDTLTLASLITTGQTLVGSPAPAVVITGVKASIDTAANFTIVRNAVEVLHAHDNFTYQAEDFLHAVLGEQSGSDIVVTLAAAGTLIVKIKKMSGYSAL